MRGQAFVTFPSTESAQEALVSYTGLKKHWQTSVVKYKCSFL